MHRKTFTIAYISSWLWNAYFFILTYGSFSPNLSDYRYEKIIVTGYRYTGKKMRVFVAVVCMHAAARLQFPGPMQFVATCQQLLQISCYTSRTVNSGGCSFLNQGGGGGGATDRQEGPSPPSPSPPVLPFPFPIPFPSLRSRPLKSS